MFISSKMIRFLVIDDHEIVRKGLQLFLTDFYPGSAVAEARTGDEAVDLLKKERFTLVILDLQIPNTNSFNILDFIKTQYPETRVLVFSMSPESLYGKRVIKAGADGYLPKESSVDDIRTAVDTLLKNKKYVSPRLVEILVEEMNNEQLNNPFSKLSSREFEIATFLLSGMPVSEIADRVSLQPSTVGTYKSRIFQKLNVSNLIELKELANIYNFR